MSVEKFVSYVQERVSDWETGSTQFRGQWNEWAAHYGMQFQDKDPRPHGISKNVNAEIPRATNTLAETITTMQTISDPPFELRAVPNLNISEERIFDMEAVIQEILFHVQYERNLLKGNRGMCLFGTQVWEKPLISFNGDGTLIQEGTALRPLSLLQVAFNTEVYDMEFSDHMTPVIRINKHILRDMAYQNPELWNVDEVEKAIDEKAKDSGSTSSDSEISSRRQRAGYNEIKSSQHLLYLYNGRVSKEIIEQPEFQEMWIKFGGQGQPMSSDITIGVLDTKYLVRLHPTPYKSWKNLYGIGHYIEFELEPYSKGVGAFCGGLQKDINRLFRYVSDVGKFNLFSMMLAGRGSGLKSNVMNIFPFSAIPVDDVDKIKPLQPNVDGMGHGINLIKALIEDSRGVSHASSTLQAVLTGATATESSLAQQSDIRSIGLIATVNSNMLRKYFRDMVRNLIDQNPYDSRYVPVQVFPKLTTDKDYKPEHSKKLLEFLNLATTIRNTMPIDFNPMPILKYLARSVGINPRELTEPRPQMERMLEVLKRLNNTGQGGEAMQVQGEMAGAGVPDGNVSQPLSPVPNSPIQGLAA